jgi:hypothetical protein
MYRAATVAFVENRIKEGTSTLEKKSPHCFQLKKTLTVLVDQ